MKRFIRPLATGLAVGTVFMAACSKAATTSAPSGSATPAASASASPSTSATTASKAADLRTKMNLLLSEHLTLAVKAVDAALGARTPEFNGYGQLLNTNGTELGAMVGAVYGKDAETAFNGIWSAHNGFFVDYTKGVAAKDKKMQDTAVNNLVTVYIPKFSDLIAGATGIPTATVADLTKTHVLTTKAIVDDLGAKDYARAYTDLRMAYAHMKMIGDPLSETIAKQKPDVFPGDAASKAVGFRVDLNNLLQEHLYLATSATGAALGGRTAEFKAAGEALNTNGTDIGAAIGSLYGPDAQTKFNGIWSAHNGFFVDYTTGVAKKDKAVQDAAVNNLTTVYIPQFSEFLSAATGLPATAVADLTKEHVLTTKAVVDAQGAGDAAGAATKDRAAAQHMEMIGDPLAAAIVAKLPAKFN